MRYIHDLPAPVGLAIENDPYSSEGADFTPSSLNDPARIRALTKRHHHELVAKASSRWRILLGQMIHGVLELTPMPEGARKEERLFSEFQGHKIGGKFDLYVGAAALRAGQAETEQDILPFTILDYKTVMAYAVVFQKRDGGKTEWHSQLNVLAWLARRNGMRVDHLQILPLILDWKADEAAKDKEYPQKPSLLLDIPLWTDEQVETFMAEKIALHEACSEDVRDADLPMCTEDERWQRGAKWALYAKGKMDKAAKLEDTKEELEAYAQRKGWTPATHISVYRPAEAKRCRFWCPVARFCDFGQVELAKLEAEAT